MVERCVEAACVAPGAWSGHAETAVRLARSPCAPAIRGEDLTEAGPGLPTLVTQVGPAVKRFPTQWRVDLDLRSGFPASSRCLRCRGWGYERLLAAGWPGRFPRCAACWAPRPAPPPPSRRPAARPTATPPRRAPARSPARGSGRTRTGPPPGRRRSGAARGGPTTRTPWPAWPRGPPPIGWRRAATWRPTCVRSPRGPPARAGPPCWWPTGSRDATAGATPPAGPSRRPPTAAGSGPSRAAWAAAGPR